MIATYVSTTAFTVVGDQTSIFVTNRRLKCDCGVDGYKYATIVSSSFSSVTTITLTAASDDLTANLTSVEWGVTTLQSLAVDDYGDLTAAPLSDHNIGINSPHCDDIAAGESVTVMDCVYLKSDGEWWKTSASGEATSEGMLAISLESKTDGQAMNVVMPGSFVRDDTWGWTVGGEIYLDTVTAGGLTQTAPSGPDDVVRVVGHATHAGRMFFNPDQTTVGHA